MRKRHSKKTGVKPETATAKSRPTHEPLARRTVARVTWEKLALPARQLGALRKIISRVRKSPTLSCGVLFAGPAGAGKTLAAKVLAKELELDLYRIDLSAVVSKYIGETEKNLKRVFDAAEPAGAILFFDEADALFGKRTEAKDSHDRYANLQTSDLLQRLETHSGLVILATNSKSNLDEAFIRRLRFVVEFPVPRPDQRRQMWQRHPKSRREETAS